MKRGFAKHLAFVDKRLATNDYLAGPALTAADMMIHFWLTTGTAFAKLDLEPYPNIQAWLKRISERPAFQRAMQKAGNT